MVLAKMNRNHASAQSKEAHPQKGIQSLCDKNTPGKKLQCTVHLSDSSAFLADPSTHCTTWHSWHLQLLPSQVKMLLSQ
jgi:hypothetical protein